MLLEATQVAIERGDRRLLSDVDLSVSAGEIWQLVGANGVGKTSLGKALARSVDGRFGRVQFTPDLLPTDVTGVSV